MTIPTKLLSRRTPAGRGVLLTLAPLFAVVTLAAGCGTATAPQGGAAGSGAGSAAASSAPAASSPPAASGTPVPTTTGGPVTPGQPACAGWPSGAPRGLLPASFVPVAALRCVENYQVIPGKGQWLTATLERADKDLGPLTAALRHPPGRNKPGMMCPEIAIRPVEIALVSSDGTTFLPVLPLSGCGPVQQQVLAALDALSWRPVSVRLVTQVQTPQGVASGCAASYPDPFLTYGALPPSPGGAVLGTRPASLKICVYRSGGATNGARFARAATVTGVTEQRLLAGLSGAGRGTPCTLPHSSFAVIQGGGSPLVYVELGGCDRVFRYQSGASGPMGLSRGQASQDAVATIESATAATPLSDSRRPARSITYVSWRCARLSSTGAAR